MTEPMNEERAREILKKDMAEVAKGHARFLSLDYFLKVGKANGYLERIAQEKASLEQKVRGFRDEMLKVIYEKVQMEKALAAADRMAVAFAVFERGDIGGIIDTTTLSTYRAARAKLDK